MPVGSHTKGMLFHLGGVPAGAGDIPLPRYDGSVWFVDGTHGSDTNDGKSLEGAKATIQAAVTAAGECDSIFILPKAMAQTDTDPGSYAETVIVNTPSLALLGVSRGLTQGGLPQIKIGAGATALLQIRAPGCLVRGLGFNGISSTGGGIKLVDDGGALYSAFGTTITGCHFKNCATHATDGRTGGAIYWASTGGAWQCLFSGNRFYKNLSDIVLVGTSGSVPQDIIIQDNIFGGPAASVDVNLWLGGSGINGVVIDRNTFMALPAFSGGSVGRYMDLVGCVGVLTRNAFGCVGLTFRAAQMGTGARVPATVFMADNYQEDGTTQIVHTA